MPTGENRRMTHPGSQNGTMKRYVGYVPMDEAWLPVVLTYEFSDDGQRVRSHMTQEGVHMTAVGLFSTRSEANRAAVRAWWGCHGRDEGAEARGRHPAGGNR